MSILITLTAGLVVGFLVGAYVTHKHAEASIETVEAEACKSITSCLNHQSHVPIYDQIVDWLDYAPKQATVTQLRDAHGRFTSEDAAS